MNYCYACGRDEHGVIPLCKGVNGHVRCFVIRNVFQVLNHGKCGPLAPRVASKRPSAACTRQHKNKRTILAIYSSPLMSPASCMASSRPAVVCPFIFQLHHTSPGGSLTSPEMLLQHI